MPGQGVPDIGPDAVDMDVQLVLRTAADGVDRQAEILPRQRLAEPSIDEAGLIPGLGEIIGRRRGEHRRALDTRDPRRRDEQILRLPHDILQDGVACRDIDDGARRGMAELGLVDHAPAMDDFPQDVRVGGSTEEDDGQQGDDDGQRRNHAPHPIQPRPHRDQTSPTVFKFNAGIRLCPVTASV